MSDITVDLGVAVPMADGTRLVGDVYRPARPGRYPVVVLRTPYDRRHAAAFGLQVNAVAQAAAGFVTVIQDVRGRGASGGAFEPFVQEAADGVRTVEWAAEQPWSNGQVAMAGMSYCGYVQAQVARERPPALRAWIPAFSPLNVRDHWTHDGGALRLAFDLSLLVGTLAQSDPRTVDPGPLRRAFGRFDELVARPLDAHRELEASPMGDAWRAWRDRPADDPYWAAISGRGAGCHDAPTLVLGGWFDVFQHGTFALHEELAASVGRTSLVIGPWDHAPLPVRSGSGRLDFGPAATMDLPGLQIAWLDHVLRDGPDPLAAAARVFVTGRNAWLDLPAWPPPAAPGAAGGCWYLGAPGALVPVPGAVESSLRFLQDAADPAPAVGGRVFARPTTLRAGPYDQSGRQARPDVATWDGPVVERPTLVAGPVRASITSTSSHPTADVVVTLCDVHPDGRAFPVADGVRRRSVVPGEPVAFEVGMGHVAHELRPGHRLRVDVAGASFPAIDRQPPHGTAERTVIQGGPAASWISVPVVEVE
jgi:putative CocE/NonD family hydrolase